VAQAALVSFPQLFFWGLRLEEGGQSVFLGTFLVQGRENVLRDVVECLGWGRRLGGLGIETLVDSKC
jgi:hypothetical protein